MVEKLMVEKLIVENFVSNILRGQGTKEEVISLIKRGFDINMQNKDGWTALMYAVSMNDDIVDTLLENGADVNIQDKWGKTSLMHACYHSGNLRLIKLLSKYSTNIEDYDGNTALIHAVSRQNAEEIINFLLDENINHQNKYGKTALMYAIEYGSQYIKLLLDHGADIQIKNILNENAITFAFFHLEAGVIDILLPTRFIFIRNEINDKRIRLYTKFWKVALCDFKIIFSNVDCFNDIIKFM